MKPPRLMISFTPLDQAGHQVLKARVAEREQAVGDKLREEYSARRGRHRQNSHQALLEDIVILAATWEMIQSPPTPVNIGELRQQYGRLTFSELVSGRLHLEDLVHPRVEGAWYALEVQVALGARDGSGAPIFADIRQFLRLPAIVRRFFVKHFLAQRERPSEPAREPAMEALCR